MNLIKFKALTRKGKYRLIVRSTPGEVPYLVAEAMQGFSQRWTVYAPKVYNADKMEAARKKYQKILEETGCAYTDTDRNGLG